MCVYGGEGCTRMLNIKKRLQKILEMKSKYLQETIYI